MINNYYFLKQFRNSCPLCAENNSLASLVSKKIQLLLSGIKETFSMINDPVSPGATPKKTKSAIKEKFKVFWLV